MLPLGTFDNVLGLRRGNPFSWLWFQGWRRPLETQIGNTHSHSRKGFRLGWMNLLWHPRECGPRRKNSEEVQMIGKTCFHLQVATTMIQLKPFQTPSKRHLWKKKPWVWWKALSPSRRQQTDVDAILVNSVLGLWRPFMKETKFVPSMMVALVGQMHPCPWYSLAPSSQGGFNLRKCPTGTTGDPMSKGSVWHWPNKDSTFLLLKADVSKAHRRIKILRSGWKYQVAQIDQQWWVNKVGTYGVASAQLYWGRMAALLLRILYALFPEVDWGFVFVDDFCWVLRASNASWLTPALLGVLLALGTPLSWKKTVLSEINTWLGFVINPSGPFVQMAKEKHVAVLALLKELEEGKAFSLKAIEKALGKIQWATATCPMAKPFLQPF